MSIATIRTVADLRAVVNGWRRNGETVAVVPTMGAFHDGHLSLVRIARSQADRVIVTLFVNPKQFNNADDLTNYPRTEEEDAEKLRPLGVDILYAPHVGEIYPDGFATNISVGGVSEGLCGTQRPGHFDGVATIVTKLLLQTGADHAYFGEKDYQQLQVVRRLVRDLDIPVEIVACPTVREDDGLAMSSRNLRLSASQRFTAPAKSDVLHTVAERLSVGGPVAETLESGRKALLDAGFREVEYLELRSDDGLCPLDRLDRPARLLAAAWLGDVRLIDNVPVTPIQDNQPVQA
ncbi:pantoate--beta-alanine ligase [Nitratireductor sp. XY-223]|uniref:pantoate--beta-alanine ligase n=1 Tax=Nitratireductor sp. XY-223 TaxID=2561926 RepID=UPI0010A9AA50|nr:pantoate--beta-alanine ligase [Nitratireductor sp. XY-223]